MDKSDQYIDRVSHLPPAPTIATELLGLFSDANRDMLFFERPMLRSGRTDHVFDRPSLAVGECTSGQTTVCQRFRNFCQEPAPDRMRFY